MESVDSMVNQTFVFLVKSSGNLTDREFKLALG